MFEVSFPKGLRKLCRFSDTAAVTRCIFQELPAAARHKSVLRHAIELIPLLTASSMQEALLKPVSEVLPLR